MQPRQGIRKESGGPTQGEDCRRTSVDQPLPARISESRGGAVQARGGLHDSRGRSVIAGVVEKRIPRVLDWVHGGAIRMESERGPGALCGLVWQDDRLRPRQKKRGPE